MSHNHLPRELLSALVDGECLPTERRWAHEHMAECSQCAKTFKDYQSVACLAKELPPVMAPQDLVAKVLLPPRHSFRRPVMRVGFAAAALAMSITLLGLLSPASTKQPEPAELFSQHSRVSSPTVATTEVLFAKR